jgi:hypothetical protein
MAINKLKYNDPNTPFQVSDLNITTPSSSSSSRVNASSINASSINSSLLTVGVGGTIITTTGIGSVGIGSTQPGAILDLNVPRSGYSGNLIDLKNNGTSLVKVDNLGRLMVGGAPFNNHLSYTSNVTPDGLLITGAAYALQVPSTFANDGFVIRESSNGNVRFEVSANTGNCHIFGEIGLGAVRDTILVRDAVSVFAQRNSTNAQTFRIYNTYTSATNFERGQVGWTTNTFIVGTEKGSAGGNPRQLDFQTNGITRVSITTTGNVGIGSTLPTAKFDVQDGDIRVGVSNSNGLILTSPNGTRYRLIVDDAGIISTVLVT